MVQESLDQYRMAWGLVAQAKDEGVVIQDDDFSYAIARIPIPMFNVAFFVRPPQSVDELLQLNERAQTRFRELGVEGMITLPSSWLPRNGAAALESSGLKQDFKVMGMRTARLNDPVHQVPEIRQVEGEEAAEIVARVNADAYGMPPQLEPMISLPKLWSGTTRAYAIFENQEPVAVGAAVTSQRINYVMWMATCEKARGKGYAQAILHRAWDDARQKDDAKLSVLHATVMGRPVYVKLGYTAIAEFPGFVSAG